MYALLALGLTAFLLCFILTPLLRDLFVRADIIDRPDGERKFHATAVPRIGGIPIVLSYAGALGMVLLFAPQGARIYVQHGALLRLLLPAAGLVFLTGLLDDLFCLKPWQKLAGQGTAAVLAVSLGARLSMGHGPAWLSIVLSVIWLIGCTNAVNLIDGMDGLATGVGLVATLTTLVVALSTHNLGLAMATVPLAGCLFAFLRYNWNPASVFLGDCGSLTIGFILGCFALIWSQKTGTLLGMGAPLMALAIPLIDVGLAIGRRFLRRVPITKGDRSHIHHMLLARGITPRRAALILYGVGSMGAILGLLASFSERNFVRLILVLFCGLVLYGINRLGYIEFSAVSRTLSHKVMRRAVQDEIYLQELSRQLAAVNSPDEYWKVLRQIGEDLQFATVDLEMDGRCFEEVLVAQSQPPSWHIQLSLGHRGRLVLTRVSEEVHPRLMMPVLHLLQSSMLKKMPVGEATSPESLEEATSITSAA